MTRSLPKLLAACVVSSAMLTAQIADACTGILLRAQDGTVVRARTLEWGAFDVLGAVSVIAPGYEMGSKMPDGSDGLAWTAKYGVVGATVLDRILLSDGINEAGLSGGLFYLPGFAEIPFENRMFYYPTQFNRQVRGIDVDPVDFAALNGQPVTLPMDPDRQKTIEMITFGQ